MSARIAAVVPVGYLDRMGYQHIWPECWRNYMQNVDGQFPAPTVYGENYSVSDSVYFGRKPDGSPWFDAYIVMEAVNHEIQLLVGHFDAAIVLMCNNYIYDADLLRYTVEAMLIHDAPWAWYYRADQLAGEMFGPSVRLPWLINLRHKAEMRLSVDCLVCDGEIIHMERGDYTMRPMVCDVQLEMTRDDLAEKMNFIRCYSDLVPKRNPVFDWGYWFPYYVDKFKKKRRADLPLTETGEAIAANSQDDFVSHEVLKCLG